MYVNRIQKLIEIGKNSKTVDIKKAAIDCLAKYGEGGIRAIHEIIKNSKDSKVKEHGLMAINKILNGGRRKFDPYKNGK
jgi:hypothetical protein